MVEDECCQEAGDFRLSPTQDTKSIFEVKRSQLAAIWVLPLLSSRNAFREVYRRRAMRTAINQMYEGEEKRG